MSGAYPGGAGDAQEGEQTAGGDDVDAGDDGLDGGGDGVGPEPDQLNSPLQIELPSFSEFAPAPVVALANNPRAFVVGAVLTTILETVFGVVSTVISAIQLVLTGRSGLGNRSQIFGLADIPRLITDTLLDAGTLAGGAILNAVENLNQPLFDAAAQTGPLAPVATFGVIAAETVLVALVLTRIGAIILDVIPGGGGLIP